jgi:hypothetical protein
MSIFKVANTFRIKLAMASAESIESLRKLMGYASSLASGYDYTDPSYDSMQNLAAKTYQVWNAAKDKGMSADQLKAELAAIKRMTAQVGASIKDSTGKSKLNALVQTLNTIQVSDVGKPLAAPGEPLPAEIQNAIPQGPEQLPWDVSAKEAPEAWNPTEKKSPKKEESNQKSEQQAEEAKITNAPNWRYIPHRW